MEAFNGTFKRIRELGLEKRVFELDSYGFTVAPPEQVADRVFSSSCARPCCGFARNAPVWSSDGAAVVCSATTKAQPQTDGQFLLFYLLMADCIFKEWALNLALYTLIDYLLRGQQRVSSLASFVKRKGKRETPSLHSNCLPACSDMANTACCLAGCTLDNSAIAMTPGSHTGCRLPRRGEGENSAVPVEAESGLLIVWHGNIWRGAFEKKTDGLRPNAASCHRRLKNQENHQWPVAHNAGNAAPQSAGVRQTGRCGSSDGLGRKRPRLFADDPIRQPRGEAGHGSDAPHGERRGDGGRGVAAGLGVRHRQERKAAQVARVGAMRRSR